MILTSQRIEEIRAYYSDGPFLGQEFMRRIHTDIQGLLDTCDTLMDGIEKCHEVGCCGCPRLDAIGSQGEKE